MKLSFPWGTSCKKPVIIKALLLSSHTAIISISLVVNNVLVCAPIGEWVRGNICDRDWGIDREWDIGICWQFSGGNCSSWWRDDDIESWKIWIMLL